MKRQLLNHKVDKNDKADDYNQTDKANGADVSHSDAQFPMMKQWALMSLQNLTMARCLDLLLSYEHLNSSLIVSVNAAISSLPCNNKGTQHL